MVHQNPANSTQIDDLHRLLANRHRRAVLAYFRDSEADVASVTEIADEISDPNEGDAEDTRLHLHHEALPRLDAAGVLAYDSRTTTVRYQGAPNIELLKESVEEL